jgi:hypothetical protein
MQKNLDQNRIAKFIKAYEAAGDGSGNLLCLSVVFRMHRADPD